MEYEKLLEQAYKKIKPIESRVDRFEVPQIDSIIQGSKTIISNFGQIASYLRRDKEHLEKFLEKEVAAQGKPDGDRLTFIKKIPSRKIDEKIQYYVKKFVICKECRKPDTEIVKKGDFWFVHCLACGARHSVSKI